MTGCHNGGPYYFTASSFRPSFPYSQSKQMLISSSVCLLYVAICARCLKVFFYLSSYLTGNNDQLYKLFLRPQCLLAVPWLRRLVAGLSLRRPEFDPRSVHVKFVVDKVALRQVFLWVLRLFPVSAIPSMFRTHLHLHVALRILQQKSVISEMSDHWMGTYLHFYGACLRENLVSPFILTMPTHVWRHW